MPYAAPSLSVLICNKGTQEWYAFREVMFLELKFYNFLCEAEFFFNQIFDHSQ